MKRINITLAAVRVNTGMSQLEWAAQLGVSQTTINNWETGKTSPNARQLRMMSDLSGIPMDYIFCPTNPL